MKASELAEFITEGIGSGGGHLEKAGGFIQMELLNKIYKEWGDDKKIADFLKWRLDDYFDDIQIIHAKEYEIDLSDMLICKKKKLPIGFVRATDVFKPGTMVSIRTLEGDLDVEIRDDIYIMIGVKGEVYPLKKQKFEKNYHVLEEPYSFQGNMRLRSRMWWRGKIIP